MMREKIIKELNLTGITEIGFVSAEEFQKKDIRSTSSFAKTESMTDVSSVMENAKTVIVFLVPYKCDAEPENLSCYATGADYHIVCEEISQSVTELLENNSYKAVGLTDNNPLCERELAKDAGLGYYGENGFLINKKYGSYVFISCVVTDCEITPSVPCVGKCAECGLCIKSCPGGALSENDFDETKCVSYITQKKGDLGEEETEAVRKAGSAWGCDICQRVCPENKNKELTVINKFRENLILCIKNEKISNREFKKKYAQRAFSWRGKGVIDRNLSIINEKNED